MRTENAPQVKYLKDYQPPAFAVDSVFLDFDLHPGVTTVTARTVYKKIVDTADLVLDGQNLQLMSVSIDGVALTADRYTESSGTLTIRNVPASFTLEIVTRIRPEENTRLEGLYSSGGNYCTQCEPEGFRHITYFLDRPDVMTTYTTRIEADKNAYPILLSNGNCTEKGDMGNGRHFAVWHDPFKKPTYLFALVAGDLAHIHDTFTTMSGRKVDLYIYVNHGNEDKCAHAMKALKDSMKWDEEKYGREYDLDIFHIVAVNDFNFGAMENKSLNIFNARLVLAKPETATDADYGAIEAVVAHEYFHNWTGNRITCRDWFQLSLKEGLTVFRDQSFSGDMNDHAVERIDNVETLRNVQFAEDASPMAHPIRPDNYIEINNFYTPTVYEKGSEIIRMFHTILGADTYRKATDLYFTRHDGQAVTCEDFIKCMEDASQIDFSVFRNWYAQAGTPEVSVTQTYDESAKKYTLHFTQRTPDTRGQTGKKPVHIPVALGLLDRQGRDMLSGGTQILHLKEAQQSFTFDNITERPVPSLFRGFSAPVKVTSDLTDDDLLFLMSHDTDGFNRWDCGQTYLQRLLLSMSRGEIRTVPDTCMAAFGRLLADKTTDRGLLAKALTLPSLTYLSQLVDIIDIDALVSARKALMENIGKRYLPDIIALYHAQEDRGAYSPDPAAVGRRRLRAVCLRYIQSADMAEARRLASAQYGQSTNMTDTISAMSILTDISGSERQAVFDDFYGKWKHEPLVLDKWFALQAMADMPQVVELVRDLAAHPDFTFKNPNRIRSLVGSFGGNLRWFHRADGAGYAFLADIVIKLNGINPSTAARLVAPLRQWRRYDTSRRDLMEKALRRILETQDLSPDVYEIVSKSLNG